ncbi:MAG: DUF4105 domain-containing protein, partial [Flavobacteriaceae bacterium]|nr:DUF4105 domain-containing protein [Flavobacteriaceae bacterium]
MKKLYILAFLITFLSKAQNIQLSPQAEISVITCGPGENELYATFGHSAFRIQDIPNKIDRVYNYGTFNFDTPNFYMNFAQGKLLYELRAYNFGAFLQSYHRENRWVKGQVLDLTTGNVQEVYEFLENNTKPKNRSYKYDFFFNNCSTKLYDVLETVLKDKIIFNNDFDKYQYTHRDLIQLYLNNQLWGDFGIDLALGSVIDKKASAKEYMFLPDFVFEAFTKIEVKSDNYQKPIVKRTEQILLNDNKLIQNTLFTPLIIFSIISLFIIILTIIDYKKQKRNKVLDYFIFTITGLIGILVLLLWFATDHTATANNFNVFWAFAPNLVFAFLIKKNHKINYYYI